MHGDETDEAKAEIQDKVLAAGRGIVASLLDVSGRTELFANPDEQFKFFSRVVMPMITLRSKLFPSERYQARALDESKQAVYRAEEDQRIEKAPEADPASGA